MAAPKPADENKKSIIDHSNMVHRMMIFEETVKCEQRYQSKNKNSEFNINPFNRKHD